MVRAKGDGAKTDREPRRVIFQMRIGEQFESWLAEFAAEQQLDRTALVRQALMHFARAKKFRPPPKRGE